MKNGVDFGGILLVGFIGRFYIAILLVRCV